jgi:hypothetical protein
MKGDDFRMKVSITPELTSGKRKPHNLNWMGNA